MFAISKGKQGRCSENIGRVVNEEERDKQNKEYKARVRIEFGCSQQKREEEKREIQNRVLEKKHKRKSTYANQNLDIQTTDWEK